MTQQQKIKRQKIAIVVLAVLLLLSLAALGGVLVYSYLRVDRLSPATAPDNIITGQERTSSSSSSSGGQSANNEVTIKLHSNQITDNSRFYLTNMFPGDVVTKPYCVEVSYKGTVAVHFRADVYQGYEKLAEVLKCRVAVEGQMRYDGLMRDMPTSISYTIQSGAATTQELDYEITVYLDTGVGNDYQNKQLMADFRWWVEGEQTPEPPTPTPTPTPPPAPDVPDIPELPQLDKGGHYAYVVGFPDGLIHPEYEITRGEAATIFFRLMTEESRQYFWCQVNSYYDVPAEKWYNNAISTLTKAGILEGRPGNLFDPEASITRAEFAAMAARFFEVEVEIEKDYFSDIADHWANYEINLAYLLNLVDGYPDGTFRPNQAITRAEAITLMNNVLERAPHKDHLLKDMIQWPDNMDPEEWYYAEIQEATNSHTYVLADPCGEEEESYEIWTALLPVRDWVALEKQWSEYNSSDNPGEPIGSILMSGNMGVLNAGSDVTQMDVTVLRGMAKDDASLNIVFSDCEVLFDNKALDTIVAGSKNTWVRVEIQATAGAELNEAQQAALTRFPVTRIVSASVNNGAVSDFGGGLATVYVPFSLPKDTGPCTYSVLYVAEDGTLEYIDSYYVDGYIVFFAEHFSDYVIVRDLDRTEFLNGSPVSTMQPAALWIVFAGLAVAAAAAALFLIRRRKEGKYAR